MSPEKNSSGRIHVRKDLLVWSFVLIVLGAITVGSVGQEPIVADANESAAVVDVAAGSNQDVLDMSEPSPEEWEEIPADGRIRLLNFESKKTIRDGLRYLAARYKKNIVPSAKVNGELTVTRLFEVTFEEALEAILGHGFKYEQEGNFIRVYTADEHKEIKQDPDRRIYKVFTLYYISAAEAKKLITPLLSEQGKVETTTAAVIKFPTGESINADSGGGDTTAMNDAIIVYDYPENIADVNAVISSLDVRPKQVLIEATILSVTLSDETQLGIDWQTLHGTVSKLSDITRGASDSFKSAGMSQSQVTNTLGLTVGFAHDNVAGFIKAVETITDVTVLANPKILAINKQLGQVYIGKKVGYRDNPMTLDSGVVSEGEVKFLDTGTKLSFRPYIGSDGYIRMDIHPKDSSGSLSSGIPSEESAEVVTNIMVKDGETIVIGGLFRDKITSAKTKVPLFGDLPVVGALFRGTADKVERREVMVLLTPHIIEEPGETRGRARMDDVARQRIGAKDAMVEIGGQRLAEDFYAKAAGYYLDGDAEAALRELDLALEFRPIYLEALRLRERIIRETDRDAATKMERNILELVEREDSSKWKRK